VTGARDTVYESEDGQPRTAALRSPYIALGEVPGLAGPGNEIASGAGGQSRLRASHADREQVIEVLKTAFVQGRLDRDEFDLRVAGRSGRGPTRT
jgi:hypothetical protein